MIPITAVSPFLLQATYSSVQVTWLPLVFLALLLDGVIVGVWYMIGYILNNGGMKGAARAEYEQFIGTGVMAAIIVVMLPVISGLLTSSMNATQLMNTGTMTTMCDRIGSYNTGLINYLAILSSDPTKAGFSFLSGTGQPGAFPGICAYITQQQSNPNADTQVSYPLAASTLVIANLTNQTAVNYYNLHIVGSYIGYLTKINPEFALCLQFPQPGLTGPCVIPPQATTVPDLVFINASYNPYAGYEMPYKSLDTVASLIGTSIEIFTAELVTTSIFLYIWPFLLFLGLVLRATPFTRKIGGLLMAVGIGVVLIYPTVFAFEYLSVGNGLASAIGSVQGTVGETISQAYGFNSITSNSITMIDYSPPGSTTPQPYIPNFFIEPSIKRIAQHYNCWPPGGEVIGPFGAEVADTEKMLLPFNNMIAFITQLISGSAPSISFASIPSAIESIGALPYSCSAQDTEGLAFAMFNAYGIIGMAALLLPLINVMVTITAIAGLSGLFGGDTGLAGLTKLV